jgi:hypothetical protein
LPGNAPDDAGVEDDDDELEPAGLVLDDDDELPQAASATAVASTALLASTRLRTDCIISPSVVAMVGADCEADAVGRGSGA